MEKKEYEILDSYATIKNYASLVAQESGGTCKDDFKIVFEGNQRREDQDKAMAFIDKHGCYGYGCRYDDHNDIITVSIHDLCMRQDDDTQIKWLKILVDLDCLVTDKGMYEVSPLTQMMHDRIQKAYDKDLKEQQLLDAHNEATRVLEQAQKASAKASRDILNYYLDCRLTSNKEGL